MGWLIVVCLALVACRTAAPANNASEVKIVGGTEVQPTDQSHQTTVALIRAGNIYCSGVLIGSNAILTAAHCKVQPHDRIGFGDQPYTTTLLPTLIQMPSLAVSKVSSAA